MNNDLIINRVSILRKGLDPKTYRLPSITDILTDGLIKKNHIDWLSVKLYLDGLYESKSEHEADINNISSRLITLSIDNEGNLEYGGYKFLNVTNYQYNSTEDLASRVTALEGNVSSILGNINTINTTLQGLPSIYASKNHTHNFSELTGISEDNGYLNIGTGGNKFVEILSSKLIELSALATEGGNVYITPKIRSGEKAILVAEPNENKKFVKWTYNNLDISTNPIHILTNPLSEAAYIGVFTEAGSDEPVQPTQYTVTISLPAHGSIVATANGENLGYGTFELNLGTIIHLEVSANTGYRFTNWSGVPTEKETLQSLDITVSANTLISANFAILLYVVTVNTAKDENGISVGTDVYPTIKINGAVQSNPVTVDYNTSVTLETVASIGNYDFQYWSDNHSKTNRVRTENIKSNLTSYPVYTRPTYEVIFGSNNTSYGTVTATYYGTSQNITSPTSVPKGSRLAFTANPKAGYELTSWSGLPNGSTYDNVEVTSNLNISAIFTAVTPTPTIQVLFGERINNVWTKFGDSVIVRYISQQQLTNPYEVLGSVNLDSRELSVEGYEFVQWEEDDHIAIEEDVLNRTANSENLLFYGTFAKRITILVTTGDSTMGSVSGGGSYLVGDTISISATANNGYHFVKWSDNNTSNPRTITVNENTTTYTAVFAINTYLVSASVSPNGSGTVTVGGTANSKSINHGSTTTLVATASSGYEFVNWTLNGTEVATTASYTTPAITSTVTYVAHFAAIPQVDETIYYFASTNDDYSPVGKTVNTLEIDSNTNKLTTLQLTGVDTLVFLAPSSVSISSIKDIIAGTEIISRFLTHSTTYNTQEYTAYYYTDPNVEINGKFIVLIVNN